MTELPVFLAGLITVTVFSVWFGTSVTQRVALTLFAGWVSLTIYVQAFNDYTPWAASIVVDAICAAIIMRRPATYPQGIVGMLFVGQIAWHVVYGTRSLLGMEPDEILYYDAITYIAWAQLLTVGIWTGGILANSILHRWPAGHALAYRIGLVHHLGPDGKAKK